MIRKNLYIFILTALFLGVAKMLDAIGFWNKIGLSEPHGYIDQGLLFLVVLFVLQNFLFGPYVDVLEERETQTTRKKALAEQTRVSADQMIAQYRTTLEQARLKAIAERERMGIQAEKEEHVQLSKTKEDATRDFSERLEELKRDSEDARAALTRETETLVKDILDRVISRTEVRGSSAKPSETMA